MLGTKNMPKRRKILKVLREEATEEEEESLNNSSVHHGPMFTIMSNAQLNETFHNKYIKEMQQLYQKMDHDAFMYTFMNMIKAAMAAEETNEYANTALMFCAKYVSSYDQEDTHPVLVSIFKWLLSTYSNNSHIRFRLCQFVNMILNALGLEAALDDIICDNIMTYMINRLRDLSPNVRVQAILALQRLQIPDNPDDVVVKTYQFHLSSDPSPRVRQAVITSMGRNYNTIPYILERLWDIDEKVRRHTYLHMSSYPARSYKVVQRLTFLEQGLNDRSEMVRKVVTSVMLPQWFESYNKDFIALITALKLDANEAEIDRYRKITKLALREIFKRQKKEDLVNNLPFDEESEYPICIPIDKLSVENTLFWLCLVEYLQSETADELDLVIPELTVFCQYVLKYCESSKRAMDKWERMESQYILLNLMEIIYTFDLGDEIGRGNLKLLLANLLKNFEIHEHTVEVIVRCAENLITSQEERLQFFAELIKDITDTNQLRNNIDNQSDRIILEELLEKQPDKSLKLKLSSLKVKILELEEQEMNFVEKKDYVQAQKIADERNACNDEYAEILKPLLDQLTNSDSEESVRSLTLSLQQVKKVTTETIIKCLQIAFYMVGSKKVKSLTPHVCALYKNFIRRHIESSQITIRDWALKCGTTYSMLYEQLSKDVYVELCSQFLKNHNIRIWKTSIECIFELLDRYGFPHFDQEDKQNKHRKPGRQLYNTMESLEGDDEQSTISGYGVDLIFMMSHFLDTCDDACIISALVHGFCRLILHGQIKNNDIVEKLLIKYFNPSTEPEVNQILGVFFDNLITKKKQEYLQPCVLPTIQTILGAPYDSPLHEIKPETVLRFVIDSTRPMFCSSGINIHNTLASSFMQEMQNNITNRELLRILSKELLKLEIAVNNDAKLKEDLNGFCEQLLEGDLESKTAQNIKMFKDIVDGHINHLKPTTGEGSDEEHEGSEDETESSNKTRFTGITNNTENGNKNTTSETEAISRIDVEDNIENAGAENNLPKETVESAELITNGKSGEAENPDNEEGKSQEDTAEKQLNTENELPTENGQASTNEIATENESSASKNGEEIIKTPTTFGRNNTTTMRYLRKSLNTQRLSSDEGPLRPPKIRIQERSPSKRFHNKENSENNEPVKKTTRANEQKDNRTQNHNGLSSSSISSKTTDNSSDDKETSEGTDRTADEDNDIIPASPNAVKNKRRLRKKKNVLEHNKEPKKKVANATPKTNVAEKSMSSDESTKSSKTGSQQLKTPVRKKPGQGDLLSPSRKKNKSNNTLTDTEVPKKDKENDKLPDKLTERQERLKNVVLTKSVEKRIRTSKNPQVRLQKRQIEFAGRTTRSTAKKEKQFNSVMTRKRLSLDKESTTSQVARALQYPKRTPRKDVQLNKELQGVADKLAKKQGEQGKSEPSNKSAKKQNKENEAQSFENRSRKPSRDDELPAKNKVQLNKLRSKSVKNYIESVQVSDASPTRTRSKRLLAKSEVRPGRSQSASRAVRKKAP